MFDNPINLQKSVCGIAQKMLNSIALISDKYTTEKYYNFKLSQLLVFCALVKNCNSYFVVK